MDSKYAHQYYDNNPTKLSDALLIEVTNNSITNGREDVKLIIVSAILGLMIGCASGLFIFIVNSVTRFIWDDFLPQLVNTPWQLALVTTIGGALVGVCVRVFGTNKGIGVQAIIESTEAEKGLSLMQIPRVVLNSFFGLVTGASMGPEAPIMVLGGYIGTCLAKKLKMQPLQLKALVTIAFGSALGAILEAPIAGALLATERLVGQENIQRRSYLRLIFATLVAASFSFGVFLLLMGPIIFEEDIIPAYTSFRFIDLVYGLILGVAGAFVGIFAKASIIRIHQLGERFNKHPIIRGTAAGAFTGLIGVVLPLALFSGEMQLPEVVSNSADLGFVGIISLALGKILLTGIAFAGGRPGR